MQNIATSAVERKACSQGPDLGRIAELPVGFDPQRFPIIAQHFFGWRPIGEIAAEVVMRLRPPREMPNRPPLTHEVPELID